jgi:hypothetical protein
MLVGYVGRIEADFVGGWAAETDEPDTVVDVIIYLDGKRIAQVPCGDFRQDLLDHKIYGQGNHGFRYAFTTVLPLSVLDRVTVRFAQTGAIVPNGDKPLSGGRPLSAVLVTAPGRSGTTLMMSRLSMSPEICVAETPPFEVRLMSYWSTVVRTLTGAANYDHSTHPDRLEGDGFMVGSNPFSHRSFNAAFRNRQLESEYFQEYASSMLRDTARTMIREYYLRLMNDRDKPHAKFFSEKNNNLHRPTRTFARAIFPDMKEIVLVRDPRDLLCSQLSYFRSEPEKVLRHVSHATVDLMRIRREEPDRVLFVKYEDMILAAEATFGQITAHLGINAFYATDDERQDSEFKAHGTSTSPEESIGRWKLQLPEGQRSWCNSNWGAFLEEFRYS